MQEISGFQELCTRKCEKGGTIAVAIANTQHWLTPFSWTQFAWLSILPLT